MGCAVGAGKEACGNAQLAGQFNLAGLLLPQNRILHHTVRVHPGAHAGDVDLVTLVRKGREVDYCPAVSSFAGIAASKWIAGGRRIPSFPDSRRRLARIFSKTPTINVPEPGKSG